MLAFAKQSEAMLPLMVRQDLAVWRHRDGLAVEAIAEGLHETTEEVQRWLNEENARCRNRPDPLRKSCADCGKLIDGETTREMNRYYHKECFAKKTYGPIETLGVPIRFVSIKSSDCAARS